MNRPRWRDHPILSGLVAAACLALLVAPVAAQEAPPPRGGTPWSPDIDAALARLHDHLGVQPGDLSPPRPWPASELRLDITTRALGGPADAMSAAAPLVRLAQQGEGFSDPSELAFLLASLAGSWLDVPAEQRLDLSTGEGAAEQFEQMRQELSRWSEALPSSSEEWQAAFAQLGIDLAHARRLVEQALAGLSRSDRQELDAAFEAITRGETQARPLALGAQLLAADRIDRAALTRAAAAAMVSLDAFLQLRPAGEPAVGWSSEIPGVDGLALGPLETPAGPLYLGGPSANRWHVPPGIIIDFGGRDRYEPAPRSGAGAGAPAVSFSVVLDLEGDDAYTDHGAHRLGAARYGLGMVRDLEGDDLYSGNELALGAAWAGVGLLIDDQGDDLYRAGRWAQGAAGAGIGLLVDARGANTYAATTFAQGYGTTLGVGLLADGRGDDSYRLVSDSARSGADAQRGVFGLNGQGCAGGHPGAEVAGGVGALWDAQGDDTYHARGRSQGHGTWYALGWLVDGAGNDAYTLAESGQGHGERFGAGGLVDLLGDDVRAARSGPAQGSASEQGVGLLFDGAGDDAASCAGPGLGHGASQGVALYLDAGGDDVYLPREPGRALGHGNRAGGLGGWGLFADTEGTDRYPSSHAANTRLWTSGSWGAGIDSSRRDREPSRASEPRAPETGKGRTPQTSSPAGASISQNASLEDARSDLDAAQPAARVRAAHRLGRIGGLEEAALLVERARHDASAWVRGAASLALMELGQGVAGPAVLSGLEPCASGEAKPHSCQWLVRTAAAWLGPEETDGSAGDEPSKLRKSLERIASLGPPETGALIMELIFDVRLEP